MRITDIAEKHFNWIERMGWHNRTRLEATGLIASEIGEAVGECLTGSTSERFGEELADIILRLVDLAYEHQIKLPEPNLKVEINWLTNTNLGYLSETLVDVSALINASRYKTFSDDFALLIEKVFLRVVGIAQHNEINIIDQVVRKMDINEERGSRGRYI